MAKEKLGDILIRAGLLDQEGLQRALNEQQRWGGQLGRYLVELGLISEEILVRALSTQYKIPAVSIDPTRVDIGVGRLVSRDICERNNLICFRADVQKRFLDVAMSDPSSLDAIDEVRVATRFNVRPYIAAPTVIDKAINFIFYGDMMIGGDLDLSPDSTLRLDSRSSELLKKARGLQTGKAEGDLNKLSLDSNPELEVSVSVSNGDPESAPEEAVPIELPDPRSEPGFHITLDVPAVDKEKLSEKNINHQLVRIEATLARNSAILKSLMETLAHKGLLTKKDIRKIVTMGD